MRGDTQEKRTPEPVLFKKKKGAPSTTPPIVSGSANTSNFPNPQKIEALIELVNISLEKLNITPEVFSNQLNNSS